MVNFIGTSHLTVLNRSYQEFKMKWEHLLEQLNAGNRFHDPIGFGSANSSCEIMSSTTDYFHYFSMRRNDYTELFKFSKKHLEYLHKPY